MYVHCPLVLCFIMDKLLYFTVCQTTCVNPHSMLTSLSCLMITCKGGFDASLDDIEFSFLLKKLLLFEPSKSEESSLLVHPNRKISE
jgi:hypothetical protein